MSTKKVVSSPFKMSAMIIGGILLLIVLINISPRIHDFSSRLKMEKEQRKIEKLEELRAANERRILAELMKPVPEVIEFMLGPGESTTIKTNGDRFEYRFYGTTHLDVFRGKYASQRHTFRNGSYENLVKYRDMAEIEAVRIMRPHNADVALGYKFTVYRTPPAPQSR